MHLVSLLLVCLQFHLFEFGEEEDEESKGKKKSIGGRRKSLAWKFFEKIDGTTAKCRWHDCFGKKLRVKVRSSGYQTRLTFERSWVRISSQLIRNGNGVKAMSGSILVPNPGSLNKEKKKNTGSLMGHTNKHHLKKISTDQKSISNIPKIKTQILNDSAI